MRALPPPGLTHALSPAFTVPRADLVPAVRSRTVLLSLVACAALAIAGSAAAQKAAGPALAGTVRDTTGGALPGCMVTAVNVTTRAQASVVTDAAGLYAFAALPPGDYRVTASLSGFQDASAAATVVATHTASLDLTLVLGGFGEQVTVTALKRGEERLGDVPIAVTAVQSTRIDELGAGSFQQVAALAPGASLVEYAPRQNKT